MSKLAICLIMMNILIMPFAYGSSLKDPTLPTYYQGIHGEKRAINGLIVDSILISKHRRIAIVNHDALEIGDTILGSKIIGIQKNTVKFKSAKHGKFTVPLHKENDSFKTNTT